MCVNQDALLPVHLQSVQVSLVIGPPPAFLELLLFLSNRPHRFAQLDCVITF